MRKHGMVRPFYYTLISSCCAGVLGAGADPREGGHWLQGAAYAQSGKTPSVDQGALDQALASTRSELTAACGRNLPLRIDIDNFIKHPYQPSGREQASGANPELAVDRLASLGSSFSSHMQALCQKDSALAGKVRSLVVRSYEAVANGKLDSAFTYVDQMSVGNRYIFDGKAGLQRGHTVYLLDNGVLSAYCDYSEGCTETDLRGVPGLGVGAGTAITSDDGPRGGTKDDGNGCISVDGEQICARGTLGFAAAVESGDCSKAKATRIAVDCRLRLAAVKSFHVEGCAIAQAHAAVLKQGSGFGGHTPNAFFVSLLKRLQECNDADQLRTVLDARWLPNYQTLKIGGEGYEDETELHGKIRKSVFAACSALRPRISESHLTGLLYHCAAAADGSLMSYPWSTRKEDQARLRSAQAARIAANRRDAAAAHDDFERRKNLPMAATFCRGHGQKTARCMTNCRKNYTCR